MSDLPPTPPPFEEAAPSVFPPMGSGGFAQTMGAFGEMLKIQENISNLFPTSRVPWNETRKFLKASTIESITATQLYKFHMDLFKKTSLGNMQLVAYAPMHYIYAVPGCPVCNLYPALNNQKVCVATTDALYRFFTEELELACKVEEIECVKDGGQVCRFKVDLQPISAYQIMLDGYDKMILSGQCPSDIDEAELRIRVEILTAYKLLENGKLSEIGSSYMQYAGNLHVEEKVFDPPWKTAEKLDEVVEKGGTFEAVIRDLTRKAVSESAPTIEVPQKTAETENVGRVKEESKSSDSFAKLLAKMNKKQ